ncbi:MAG TPA: DUF2085 domain-containing protein [Pyrinomonadaceae bacterium]|nr:DUF2085 domain-containing protein [Pyrinomonadaceae bacterium]
MPSPITDYVPQVAGTGSRRAWAVWGAGAGLAALFVGVVLLAPAARAAGWVLLSEVLYGSFRLACHQMPERAFAVAGHPLAVCARCSGLYAGALAGFLVYPLARAVARTDAPRRGWLLWAAAPTSVDFALGVLGLWENTHWSRFLTALPLGATAAFYIVPGLVELGRGVNLRFPRAARRRRVTGGRARDNTQKLYQS